MERIARELLAIGRLIMRSQQVRTATSVVQEVSPLKVAPLQSDFAAIKQFRFGDMVKPMMVEGDDTYGMVTKVNCVENKVYVYWHTGIIKQHDPEEVALYPFMDETVRKRFEEVATCAMRENGTETPVGPGDVGEVGATEV